MRAATGHRGTYNIATGVETNVRRLWEILADESATSIEPELAPLRSGELEHSCMDTALAREQLGFTASVSVDEGLRQTYRALVDEFRTGSVR